MSVTSVVGRALQSTSTPETVVSTVVVVEDPVCSVVVDVLVSVEVDEPAVPSSVVAPHPASSRVAAITPVAIFVRRFIVVSSRPAPITETIPTHPPLRFLCSAYAPVTRCSADCTSTTSSP